jgi:hypothetical protein
VSTPLSPTTPRFRVNKLADEKQPSENNNMENNEQDRLVQNNSVESKQSFSIKREMSVTEFCNLKSIPLRPRFLEREKNKKI